MLTYKLSVKFNFPFLNILAIYEKPKLLNGIKITFIN